MSRYGYSYVPEKGFLAFSADLSQDAWKDVSIKQLDTPPPLSLVTFLKAPRPVVWKLRLTWGIRALIDANATGAEAVAQLDEAWDSVQRKLHFCLGTAGEDKDIGRRQAAERLRGALLLGNGTGQTKLGWQEEVDFGRRQIKLAVEGPFADDVKKLSLKGLFEEIDATTEALASGIGRGSGKRRAGNRTARLREALAECVAAFNGVHDEIAWLLEYVEAGEERDHLAALLTPFEALLERYPAPAASRASASAPAPAPASVVPASVASA